MVRTSYISCRTVDTEPGEWMPGVIEVSRTVPIGIAIENIVLLVECSTESEWEGQILYLPL